MINKILLRIMTFFFGSSRRGLKTVLAGILLILFGILMVIRIFWKPIENLMIFIAVITALIIIWRTIHNLKNGKSLERKFDDVHYLISSQKYDKAFELNEKILKEDIPNTYGNKDVLYTCLYYKAQCLYQKIYDTSDIDKYKELIRLFEEVAQLALELKKNAFLNVIIMLGFLYSSLGKIQNDKTMFETALEVYNNGLDSQELLNDSDSKKTNIALIHKQIGQCYVNLADYEDREEHLKNALADYEDREEYLKNELVDYDGREEYLKMALAEYESACDELSREKYKYNYYLLLFDIASALRKLNEISFDEDRKAKSLKYINEYMSFLDLRSKKINKKNNLNSYFIYQYNYASAYYELVKLTDSDEFIEKFMEYERKIRECNITRPLMIKEVDRMARELGRG